TIPPSHFYTQYIDHQALHSFPTRRSSDLEHHVKLRTSPKTLETYKYLISNHIAPQIGKIPLDKLTPYQLQRMYSYLLAHETNARSEEHTSELQSRENLVCRLLLEKKKEKQ